MGLPLRIWSAHSHPEHAAFSWLLAGGLFYTIGGIIYALRLPFLTPATAISALTRFSHLFVMAEASAIHLYVPVCYSSPFQSASIAAHTSSDPLLCLCGNDDCCPRLYREPFSDQFDLLLNLAALDLVELCRDDDRRKAILTDPVIHDCIIFPGSCRISISKRQLQLL